MGRAWSASGSRCMRGCNKALQPNLPTRRPLFINKPCRLVPCFFVGAGAISTVRNFLSGWRRMGVRARNDDGLRGSLAAAEYPTVV
jgi:hypothetical protein